MNAHILVIDEDPAQRRALKAGIEAQGHVVHIAESDHEGLNIFRRHRDEINAILVDLSDPSRAGAGFINTLGDLHHIAPVIVQTAEGAMQYAIEAMRVGAFEFLVKPSSTERVVGAIESALKVGRYGSEGRPVRRARSGAVGFNDIIAASAAMSRAVELGRRASQSMIPIMLEGEAGVGKEMLARAIHGASERSGRTFASFNCAAVPHGLMEAQLFGSEGALHPGSGERHAGKFAEADGGTLFIEEISELPQHLQVKLLGAVQSGEIEPSGGRKPRKVNVRLILATNKDLIEEVKSGRFREDLYYRLNVFPITIPALRRRREDIPHLVRAFIERFSSEQRLAKPLSIDAATLAMLTSFDWPGNVRQLENAVFRAVVLSDGGVLIESSFPQVLAQVSEGREGVLAAAIQRAPLDERTVAAAVASAQAVAEEIVARRSEAAADGLAPVQPDNVIVSTDEAGNVRKLADVEEELIRFALKFYRGQMSQVARKLGIGRSTLYRKLKDYGIDPDDPQKHAA